MLEEYKLIAKSLVSLFRPLVEVVIHDFEKNRIVFIDGKASLRKVGDSSNLTQREREMEAGIVGPYIKNAPDGSLQKSISVILGKEKKYMLCVNFDVQHFKEMEFFLKGFINLEETKSQEIFFEDNWQDKIHKFIADYLASKNKTVAELGREEKQHLVKHLEEKGAFRGKNAASYIGKILKISRASVYSYLKGN